MASQRMLRSHAFRRGHTRKSGTAGKALAMEAQVASSLETAVSAMLKQARSPEWYAEQERLFRDAIKPIQAMKVRLYSLYLPTIILDSEGNLVSAAYPDEMQKHIAELDKIIEGIAASCDTDGAWTAKALKSQAERDTASPAATADSSTTLYSLPTTESLLELLLNETPELQQQDDAARYADLYDRANWGDD
jgi:hypothetical protein